MHMSCPPAEICPSVCSSTRRSFYQIQWKTGRRCVGRLHSLAAPLTRLPYAGNRNSDAILNSGSDCTRAFHAFPSSLCVYGSSITPLRLSSSSSVWLFRVFFLISAFLFYVSVCISCYFPAFLPFFPPSVFLLHFYSNFFFLPLYEKHFSSSYLYICPSLHHIYHLFYVSLIFFTLSLTYLHTYQPAWMFAFWSACVRAHPTRASSASGPFPPNRAGVNMQERAWLHISTDSVHTASSIKSLF